MKNFSRLSFAAVSATAALLLAGCSSEPSVPVDQPVGASVDPARVTVVEAGANPVLLEYKDLGAEAQNVTVEYATGMTQEVLEGAAVENTPTLAEDLMGITAPMEAETAEPTNSDSQRSVTVKLGDAIAEDPQVNQELESVRGFRFGWFANNNGQLSSVNFAAPTQASDEGRATMESVFTGMVPTFVIFPTEPVGVGGSWTVDNRTSGASTMLQTVTYTVSAIDGDNVELDVSISQRPSMGAIPFTEGEEEKTLQVLNANTTSEGKVTVNLSKPIPVAGSIHYTTRVVYGENNTSTRVVQDSTTKVTYK